MSFDPRDYDGEKLEQDTDALEARDAAGTILCEACRKEVPEAEAIHRDGFRICLDCRREEIAAIERCGNHIASLFATIDARSADEISDMVREAVDEMELWDEGLYAASAEATTTAKAIMKSGLELRQITENGVTTVGILRLT